MPRVSNDVIRAFSEAFDGAFQRLGGGKVAIDSNVVREVVRKHQEAAYRYVEIHCVMAASQPGYLQPAMIVASAYQIEFGDESLVRMVSARADELHAHSHLASIGFTPHGQNPAAEPPEREAARAWWKTSQRPDGMCDACRAPLRRGDGYLLDGRLMFFGESKMNMGPEMLCAACFEKFRNDPRDPGGKGDNYVRIG